MTFKAIKTNHIYQGRAFEVRQDLVSLPDGRQMQMDIVEHAESVTLVPISGDGFLWVVRQYRHAAGQELWELPAGVIEPGEDPTPCAQRELREEIGMSAGLLTLLGGFFLAPGYSTEYMHVFLAQNLTRDPLPGDINEFLHIEKIPLRQVEAYIQSGHFRDAKSIASLGLAKLHLAQPG